MEIMGFFYELKKQTTVRFDKTFDKDFLMFQPKHVKVNETC